MKKLSVFLFVLALFPSAVSTQAAVVDATVVAKQVNAGARSGADAKGKSLIAAIKAGKTEKALALIKEGADINFQNKEGETPLYVAFGTKNLEVAQKLIDKKAATPENINDQFLSFAKSGRLTPEMLKLFVKAGADVNAKDFYGMGALYYVALEQRDPKMTQELVHAGADVNERIKNENNNTLLHEASDKGRKPIIKALLAGGADTEAKNDGGETPIELANSDEVAELLMMGGADYSGYYFKMHHVCSKEFALFAIEKRIEELKTELANFAIETNDMDMFRAMKSAHMLPKNIYVDVSKVAQNAEMAKFLIDNDVWRDDPENIAFTAVAYDNLDLLRVALDKKPRKILLDDAMHEAGKRGNTEMIDLLYGYGVDVCALEGTAAERTAYGQELLKTACKN